MSLGDFFPDKMKQGFAQRNIDLGNAILIKIPDFDVNYEKYIIVVAKDKHNVELAFVVINTEKNKQIFHTPYLKSLHVKIDKENHKFLDYDSYVDCSKLREFPVKKVVEFLKENPDRAVGNVSENVLRSIYATITSATTIETFFKKKYGFL